jgi:hypothetical protein
MQRLLVATAAASVVLATPTLAQAATGTTGAAHGASFSARGSVVSGSLTARSSYFAGYLGTARRHVKELIVKDLVVPTINCHGKDFQGVALGVGSEPTAGTPEYLAAVVVSCVDGVATYALDAVVGGEEQQSSAVAAGDHTQIVMGSGSCQADGSCNVFAGITDLASTQTAAVQGTITPSTTTGMIGAFPLLSGDGDGLAPVPDFGFVEFRGCQFNGHGLGHARRLNRHQGRWLQLETGPLAQLTFGIRFGHH